jgi:hypothetical protein
MQNQMKPDMAPAYNLSYSEIRAMVVQDQCGQNTSKIPSQPIKRWACYVPVTQLLGKSK